jgi:hypothetical protein
VITRPGRRQQVKVHQQDVRREHWNLSQGLARGGDIADDLQPFFWAKQNTKTSAKKRSPIRNEYFLSCTDCHVETSVQKTLSAEEGKD